MKHELTSKRLRIAMSRANITAQELSIKSGVAKASISQYVNGSHKPSNISSGKMASILDVNPLWLMGFDVSMENNTQESSNIPKIMRYFNSLNDIGKHEAEKRVEELTYIPQYSVKVQAAHNYFENVPGEQEKMQADLNTLKRPE